MPDRTGQVRAKIGHTLHPDQRQLAQRCQLNGLGIGAKHSDVLHHRIFNLCVVGQLGAGGQSHLLDGTPLGRAIFKAFFNHQCGGGRSDFGFKRVHLKWALKKASAKFRPAAQRVSWLLE